MDLKETRTELWLEDLEGYNPITIQCHDNPDADAIASGYGLYCYFQSKGKDVSLVYSGRNQIQKSNLVLMRDMLKIPVEYIPVGEEPVYRPGLLITADCQYGAGNVTRMNADAVAIIDHHQREIEDMELTRIHSGLGSCSTLVWQMLLEAGYEVTDENGLGTALYYGLYTDTNQFSEIFNPTDRDARDMLPFKQSLVTTFRNSNISLEELDIAGIAMRDYFYDDHYKFAVVRSQPCDPNILGLINDFLLQVDKMETSVVFNENSEGYKISVRSCVQEVNASELASFLTEGIGSGGGHYEKAGGFISKKKYVKKFGDKLPETYFKERMAEYHEGFELIYAKDYEADLAEFKLYEKLKTPIGYVKADEVVPIGTPIIVRTMEGDTDIIKVTEKDYIMIGVDGEVYPIKEEKFNHSYEKSDREYCFERDVVDAQYIPTIRNCLTGENTAITSYAKTCIPTGQARIYAKPVVGDVKVFTLWGKYYRGRTGDYLAVRCDDLHDVYLINKNIFAKTYAECEG